MLGTLYSNSWCFCSPEMNGIMKKEISGVSLQARSARWAACKMDFSKSIWILFSFLCLLIHEWWKVKQSTFVKLPLFAISITIKYKKHNVLLSIIHSPKDFLNNSAFQIALPISKDIKKLIFLITYKISVLKFFFPSNRILESWVHQRCYWHIQWDIFSLVEKIKSWERSVLSLC